MLGVKEEEISVGFTLEVKPGAYIKLHRSIKIEGPLSEAKDQQVREDLLKKLKEDFKFYKDNVIG